MSDNFNPYREWLGIDAQIVQPTYYQLLGISPTEQDETTISQAAERALSKVRSQRPGDRAAQWAKLLDELTTAKKCLTDPAKRAEYAVQLNDPNRAAPTPSSRPAPRSQTTTANPGMFPPGMTPPGASPQGALVPQTPATPVSPQPQNPTPQPTTPVSPAAQANPIAQANPMAPAGQPANPMAPVGQPANPMTPANPMDAFQQGASPMAAVNPRAANQSVNPMAPANHQAVNPMTPVSQLANPMAPTGQQAANPMAAMTPMAAATPTNAVNPMAPAAGDPNAAFTPTAGDPNAAFNPTANPMAPANPMSAAASPMAPAGAVNQPMAAANPMAAMAPVTPASPAVSVSDDKASSSTAVHPRRKKSNLPLIAACIGGMVIITAGVYWGTRGGGDDESTEVAKNDDENKEGDKKENDESNNEVVDEPNKDASETKEDPTAPENPTTPTIKQQPLLSNGQNNTGNTGSNGTPSSVGQTNTTDPESFTPSKPIIAPKPKNTEPELVASKDIKIPFGNTKITNATEFSEQNATKKRPSPNEVAVAPVSKPAMTKKSEPSEPEPQFTGPNPFDVPEDQVAVLFGGFPEPTAAPPSKPAPGTPMPKRDPLTLTVTQPAATAAGNPKRADVTKLAAAMQAARQALEQKAYDKAMGELTKVEALPKLAKHQEMFGRLHLLSQYAKNFDTALKDSLQRLDGGDNIELANGSFTGVVDVTPQMLVVRVAGQNRRFPINNIDPGLAVAIVNKFMDKKDPIVQVTKAAFLASLANPKASYLQKAREWMEDATARNAPIDDLVKILDDKYDNMEKDFK